MFKTNLLIETNNKGFKRLNHVVIDQDVKEDELDSSLSLGDGKELYFPFFEYDIFSLARHQKYTELEALFLKGLNPESRDEFGNTILIVGAQNGNKRIVKIALRYGAQINMYNNMGNTALHFAVEYKYRELTAYLLKKGANPEIKNLRKLKAIEGVRRKQDNIENTTSAVRIKDAKESKLARNKRVI